MSMKSLLAHQLGRPSGLAGLFMGRLLNRVNARVNATALDLLRLQPSDRVLDVGFGGGLLLRQALERIPLGVAAGIDVSAAMLRRARRVFRREIDMQRIELWMADVSAIPYPDCTFDKVASINTLHFWPDPPRALREVCRVMKPGGRVVLGLRPGDFLERVQFTKHGFTAFDDEQLITLLSDAGFCNVDVQHHADADIGMVIVVATRSADAHAEPWKGPSA
jgi:arsenite methyltransferase